jgi:hypothetical protein
MGLYEQAQPYVGKIDYRKNLTPDLAIIQVQPADIRLRLILKQASS